MVRHASVVKTNTDELPLPKRLERVAALSVGRNNIKAKYNASYRNAQNTNRLLGRALTLRQAATSVRNVALFGADIPLEDAGGY
jgi:hypothetical protein